MSKGLNDGLRRVCVEWVATGISRWWVQGEIQFILGMVVVNSENDMGHDFDNTLCIEGLS